MWILILQEMFLEVLLDLLYFPVWWYAGGVLYAGKISAAFWNRGNEVLAPALWLRNIFVPMFGQYDLQGRIISFFMRFMQILFRLVGLLGWSVFSLLLFFVWLIIPPFIIYCFFAIGK